MSKKFPYWREGMTPEEYLKEEEYYAEHFEDLVQTGKYKPLWQQKNN